MRVIYNVFQVSGMSIVKMPLHRVRAHAAGLPSFVAVRRRGPRIAGILLHVMTCFGFDGLAHFSEVPLAQHANRFCRPNLSRGRNYKVNLLQAKFLLETEPVLDNRSWET